ncbi:HTH domain-containing protein [Haliangium sp.]|uniref:HTH domain-containing protein n=1 Tax=Haliangium sp. TaxID=2663208 RepID=UPI003D0D8689
MNFIEAALSILEHARAPLTAEELTARAVDGELLSKPGKNPLRSMKGRLTAEYNKGADSRLERVGDDQWQIAGASAPAPATKGRRRKRRSRSEAGDGGADTVQVAESGLASAETDAEPAEPAEAAEGEGGDAPTGKKRRSRRRRRRSGAAASAQQTLPDLDTETAAELDALLAPKQRVARATPALTPDEDQIAEIYRDELSGTEPGAAFAEYRDEQTEDEDRPLVPEIVANRRDRRKPRERGRRERRERRGGEAREAKARAGADGARPAAQAERVEARPAERVEQAPPASAPAPALAPAAAGSGMYRPGHPLGDAAAEVMRTLPADQPVQITSLAQMMRKRQHLNGDAKDLWGHLKASLLTDEQRRRDGGVRPSVIYQGRDLFRLGPAPSSPALAEAERVLAEASEALSEATHAALAARLSSLSVVQLERLVHVYLTAIGWSDLEWIKRVGRASYGVGDPGDGVGPIMVGVRAGDTPIERRGVGELRAGVTAKNLTCGLLLAPQPLSERAQRELARSGRSISVCVGDRFVGEMIRCGIGVRRKQVEAIYFDDGVFAEVCADE